MVLEPEELPLLAGQRQRAAAFKRVAAKPLVVQPLLRGPVVPDRRRAGAVAWEELPPPAAASRLEAPRRRAAVSPLAIRQQRAELRRPAVLLPQAGPGPWAEPRLQAAPPRVAVSP